MKITEAPELVEGIHRILLIGPSPQEDRPVLTLPKRQEMVFVSSRSISPEISEITILVKERDE